MQPPPPLFCFCCQGESPPSPRCSRVAGPSAVAITFRTGPPCHPAAGTQGIAAKQKRGQRAPGRLLLLSQPEAPTGAAPRWSGLPLFPFLSFSPAASRSRSLPGHRWPDPGAHRRSRAGRAWLGMEGEGWWEEGGRVRKMCEKFCLRFASHPPGSRPLTCPCRPTRRAGRPCKSWLTGPASHRKEFADRVRPGWGVVTHGISPFPSHSDTGPPPLFLCLAHHARRPPLTGAHMPLPARAQPAPWAAPCVGAERALWVV